MTLLQNTAGLRSSPVYSPDSAGSAAIPREYPTPYGCMTEPQIAAILEAELAAEVAAEAARQPASLPPVENRKNGSAAPPPSPAGLTRRGTPRIRKRDVKWRHAAVMIARGVGITEVSYEYGVCESQILRNLRRSARFRQWIREAEAAVEADAARHAAWLRLRAASNLADRAESRDPKTLELLARPIADLTRNRVDEAVETRPEAAYARLSGFTKRDFR